MGLSIKQTSGIQRNLPARSVSIAVNGPPPTFETAIPMTNPSSQTHHRTVKMCKFLN